MKTKIKEIKKILEKDLANYNSGDKEENNINATENSSNHQQSKNSNIKLIRDNEELQIKQNNNSDCKLTSVIHKDPNAAKLYEMNLGLIKDPLDSEYRKLSSDNEKNKALIEGNRENIESQKKQTNSIKNFNKENSNLTVQINKRLPIPHYIIYEQKLIEKSRSSTKNFQDKVKEDVLINRKCININQYLHDFLSCVDQEIKKFYNFFKNLEIELKKKLNDILTREITFHTLNLFQISDEILFLESLSKLTLQVCYFININITALRKILKKFDKTFGLEKNPVALYYLNEMFQSDKTYLNYILKFKIIDESSALIEKLSNDLEVSMEKRISRSDNNYDDMLKEPLLLKNLDVNLENDLKIEVILKTYKKKFSKLRKQIEKIDDANNLLRTSFEIYALIMKSHMRVVDDYFSKRDIKHLKYENEAKEDIIQKLTPQINREEDMQLEHHSLQNIWITLIHTYFYMMNCYIIQPTNALYVQNLGASPMLSGLVMGMTPFAAIFSTFVYSKWTNKSYKNPLIFSSFCFIFGNILYSFADYFNSLLMMGSGRFFIGLASARVVNRRYLIDKIPHQMIMHYSLLYVVFTCIGMAGGN